MPLARRSKKGRSYRSPAWVRIRSNRMAEEGREFAAETDAPRLRRLELHTLRIRAHADYQEGE